MNADAWTEAFLQRSHPACPECRQSIDVLANNTCPHCRSPIALGLGAVEAFLLPWGILLAGLAAATGLGLLLDLGLLFEPAFPFQKLFSGLSLGRLLFFCADLIAGPVGLILVLLALRKRQRFCALSRSTQWTVALLAAGLPVLLAVFFFAARP